MLVELNQRKYLADMAVSFRQQSARSTQYPPAIVETIFADKTGSHPTAIVIGNSNMLHA